MYTYDRRTSAEKDSEKFKRLQKELREIGDRLDQIAEEATFSPETLKKLPGEYRSKSTWMDFPTVPKLCGKASTAVSSIASVLHGG